MANTSVPNRIGGLELSPTAQASDSIHGNVTVQRVQGRAQRELFKELMGRFHYLGYAMPFGARLQYLVYVTQPWHELVGCVQFSSPAWRMKARDQWIGWDDGTRKQHLQHIVNNNRLLVLPWIANLASMMLSCAI